MQYFLCSRDRCCQDCGTAAIWIYFERSKDLCTCHEYIGDSQVTFIIYFLIVVLFYTMEYLFIQSKAIIKLNN